MAAISSLLSSTLLQQPTKSFRVQAQAASRPSSSQLAKPCSVRKFHGIVVYPFVFEPKKTLRTCVATEEASVSTQDPSSVAARRLYFGNIPRNLKNPDLEKLVEEHGAVENVEIMFDKYSGRSRRFAFVTMKTVEDANAVIEKMNGTEVGGRQIKVNITEKPLDAVGAPIQVEESNFVDSPHKVYVGNLAKTVTSESLTTFFSEKGNVLSARVSRVPGTSKSTGFGFVSFSSAEDVEAAISSFNNALLEGQKIRVNKA